jgi:hypothetical protein
MIKQRNVLTRALLGCLVYCGYSFSQPVSAKSERSMVTLTGRVEKRREWGPPGFGETPKRDTRIVIYLLKLKMSRTARDLALPPDGTHLDDSYREVQLRCDSTVFPQCELILKSLQGRQVTVVGEPGYAIHPTDYVPIVVQVRLIQRP